jgi:hypothetical protein
MSGNRTGLPAAARHAPGLLLLNLVKRHPHPQRLPNIVPKHDIDYHGHQTQLPDVCVLVLVD